MVQGDEVGLPIAHKQSVPLPFVSYYVLQYASILGNVYAVDFIVRSHDRCWVAESRREHEWQ